MILQVLKTIFGLINGAMQQQIFRISVRISLSKNTTDLDATLAKLTLSSTWILLCWIKRWSDAAIETRGKPIASLQIFPRRQALPVGSQLCEYMSNFRAKGNLSAKLPLTMNFGVGFVHEPFPTVQFPNRSVQKSYVTEPLDISYFFKYTWQ